MVRKLIRLANWPVRKSCDHLFDKKHTPKHRMGAGVVFAIVGVGIAKIAGHCSVMPIAFAGDIVGYFLHGAACIPFIDKIVENFNKE